MLHRSAEHGRAQIAHRRCDRTARPQCHRFERPAVCAQRRFVLSAAVDVVEHDTREPPLRPAPQVFDVQNARRLELIWTGDVIVCAQAHNDLINTGFEPGAKHEII